MASQPAGGPEQVREMWEAGSRSLLEGWRQAQEFWNNAARGWGEVAGAWMSQLGRPAPGMSTEGTAALRELHEAAFAAGQAWMRLPLVLASGAPPSELQEAVTRLAQAQGRAYKLWVEALTRASEAARPGGSPKP